MLTFANVATPLTAAVVAVPDRVAPPGLVPSAAVTVPVNAVAACPEACRAGTGTAGAIAAPAAALLGSTVNTSSVAAPGVMLNPTLVAPLSPVAAAVSV